METILSFIDNIQLPTWAIVAIALISIYGWLYYEVKHPYKDNDDKLNFG